VNLRLPALVGIVILGMAMVAAAGAGNASKLVGVWEVIKSESIPKGATATAEFTKDGKVKLKFKAGEKEFVVDGTYKVKDDKISTVLSFGGKTREESATIKKLTSDELHILDEKGKLDEYKRVK
jgi:uncharacterized protein (TIGR03066 family)